MPTFLRRRLQARPTDAGFTLPELLITVVIMGILATSIGATIVVSIKLMGQTSSTLGDSGNRAFSTVYFGSDAQQADTMSIAPTAPACGNGTLLVGFQGTEFGPMPGASPWTTPPTDTSTFISWVTEPTVNPQGLPTVRLVRKSCWPTASIVPNTTLQLATDLAAADNPATPTVEAAPAVVCYQQSATAAAIMSAPNIVPCSAPTAVLAVATLWSDTTEKSFQLIGTRRARP